MFKRLLLSMMVCAVLLSCGYRLVITGTKASFTIYPKAIVNKSGDIEADFIFTNAMKSFMATNGMLETVEKSDYLGEFTLSKLSYLGSNASSNVTLVIAVRISDKSGEEVYSNSFSASENYTASSIQSETLDNRREAVTDAVNTAMQRFRNEFKQ